MPGETARFVMVPVPEEHVLEVMGFVRKLATRETPDAPPGDWDQDSLTRFFSAADARTRQLLSFLADDARAGTEVKLREVAEALGVERSQVAGVLGPLTRRLRKARFTPLFEGRLRTSTSSSGESQKRRTLVMSQEVAAMVRTAERAVGDEDSER